MAFQTTLAYNQAVGTVCRLGKPGSQGVTGAPKRSKRRAKGSDAEKDMSTP